MTMTYVTKQRDGRVFRIGIRGAIALGLGTGTLRREVSHALRRGVTRIVVDARGLRFLDAAGLGELVDCRALAGRSGARLVLQGASGKVLEMLKVTGLVDLFVNEPGPRSGAHRQVAWPQGA